MSDETPAETIRRAASLMRERAEGCEPRRWHLEVPDSRRYPQAVVSDGNVSLIAECYTDPAHRPYEAEHIASWHPLVAAAVAEWLDTAAERAEGNVFGAKDLLRGALNLARVYLGEPKP